MYFNIKARKYIFKEKNWWITFRSTETLMFNIEFHYVQWYKKLYDKFPEGFHYCCRWHYIYIHVYIHIYIYMHLRSSLSINVLNTWFSHDRADTHKCAFVFICYRCGGSAPYFFPQIRKAFTVGVEHNGRAWDSLVKRFPNKFPAFNVPHSY